MIVSKFRSGLCYPPDLIVWRPIVWNPLQLAKCHVEMTDRRSVIFVKPFSSEQRLREPVISRSNKGMVVILSEAISELPSDCIGVRIVQSFDRYAFGEVVKGDMGEYFKWRMGLEFNPPVESRRVTIERHGDEHFCCKPL